MRAARPCPDSTLASASYSEPSLVFLVGERTRLIGPGAAADFLLNNRRCGLALIGRAEADPFLARLAAAGVTPRKLAEVSGIDYSAKGRTLDLSLYTAAASP